MESKVKVISPIRKIAVVKWHNRPYVLVRYLNPSGLLFGVVRLCDVQVEPNTKVVENQIYSIRLENEFKHRAIVIHQSSYSSCLDGFSIMYNHYRRRNGL